jgi:ABC-type Fe3+ transport system permease subunit
MSMLLAIVVAFAIVVGWLGRSLNAYRNPATAPSRYRREIRREALNNVVRGWLLVAVLCPVMCVALYALTHAGSG